MIEIDLSDDQIKTEEISIKKSKVKKAGFFSNMKKERGSLKFRPTKLFSMIFVLISVLILGLFLMDKYGGQLLATCQEGNCIITKGVISGIVKPNPELQKSNGKTSILVVGLDSRNAKKEGQTYKGDLMNTDTLIQIIYDHEKKETYMVSIPRDLYVNIANTNYQGKINGLFNSVNTSKGDGEGIKALKKQIETMTGVKIQYHTIVTFKIVEDLINTFGDEKDGEKGLYINVPESFNELFPDDKNGGYFRIHFDEGEQFITTEKLMQYSRARQLTSDWKRAERQQQVIDALKDKVLSTESLLDLNNLFDLYTTFQENIVMSPVSIEDIRAALDLKDSLAGDYTSVVLDPTLGGVNNLISTLPAERFQGASLQGPVDYDYTYSKVNNFLQKIYRYPFVYEDEAKVIIYNYTGENEITDPKLLSLINSLPLDITVKNYAVKDIGYEVYDFSEGEKNNTLKTIETKLSTNSLEAIDTETGVVNFQNYFGEDISIRIGTTTSQKPEVTTVE